MALATFWPAGVPSAQQNPPQFRAGVTLVPIEVRAIDKDGKPVTDLAAADFRIQEAGRPQELALFRAVSLETPTAGTPGRTFLIVLGRGRLNQPTKALQALIDFVRLKALPQDRIGVAAYLRVIEPTTNHDGVARFLESYRDRHETTDGLLNADMRHIRWPLPPIVGSKTRAAIDAAFRDHGLVNRDLPGGAGNAVSRFNDFRYLRNALEYLRYVEGEKHAIMVSQEPFGMGVVHDDPLKNFWFREAASARTALTYVHAGGINSPVVIGVHLTSREVDAGEIKDYALVAGQTGGIAAFYKFADQPLTTLDRITRHHYVIGYYPAQQIPLNEFRSFTVTVTRPDIRLLYRQGYLAEVLPERPEDHRRAVTENRLQEGAYRLLHPWPRTVGGGIWWTMRLAAPKWTAAGPSGQARVTVSFDPVWMTFVRNGDDYLADLDLALIADDAERNVLAERRLKPYIRLTPAEFARTKREWLKFDATIDVKTRPAYLRAVLYDFETERTASTQIKLLPPASSGGGH